MKKYMASLVPFFICAILSFAYGNKAPKDYPDPSYPYQTEGMLNYLSDSWLYIGAIMSASLIAMFLIGDAFDWAERKLRK